MATRSGIAKWYPEFFNRFQAVTVFDLLVDYLKSGRIKLDKSKLASYGRATYHDPCNYGRKSLERFHLAFYKEGRWIMDQCFDHWVDMFPAKGNQLCCGGGGGTLLTPYTRERIHYGRRKMEQIEHCRAELVVVPCHSCHGQIKAMADEAGRPELQVKYLWEVVAEALVVEAG